MGVLYQWDCYFILISSKYDYTHRANRTNGIAA